jgi:hypothetical protein
MSILAWAAVVLVVWLVVGFLAAIPICRFIHAGANPSWESSSEVASQADAPTLHVVDEEYPIAAMGRQVASGA